MPRLLRQQPGAVSQYFEEHHQQGRVREFWMSKCRHCQHLTEYFTLASKRNDIHVCKSCMGLICEGCVGKPCFTDEEQLLVEERIAAGVAKAHEIYRWFNDR